MRPVCPETQHICARPVGDCAPHFCMAAAVKARDAARPDWREPAPDPVEAILAVECPQCFASPGTACYDFLARDPAHHSSRIRRALVGAR